MKSTAPAAAAVVLFLVGCGGGQTQGEEDAYDDGYALGLRALAEASPGDDPREACSLFSEAVTEGSAIVGEARRVGLHESYPQDEANAFRDGCYAALAEDDASRESDMASSSSRWEDLAASWAREMNSSLRELDGAMRRRDGTAAAVPLGRLAQCSAALPPDPGPLTLEDVYAPRLATAKRVDAMSAYQTMAAVCRNLELGAEHVAAGLDPSNPYSAAAQIEIGLNYLRSGDGLMDAVGSALERVREPPAVEAATPSTERAGRDATEIVLPDNWAHDPTSFAAQPEAISLGTSRWYDELRWSGWGTDRAVGKGLEHRTSCGSCPEEPGSPTPVTILASEPGDCSGRRYYLAISVKHADGTADSLRVRPFGDACSPR